MNSNFRFNREFGLHISDRLDGTYYSLVILSVAFFSILVLILANLNYSALEQDANQIIFNRYKAIAATFITEDNPVSDVNAAIAIKTEEIIVEKATRNEIAKKAIEKSVSKIADKMAREAKKSVSDSYDLLPEVEDYVGNLNEIEANQLTRGGRWPAGSFATPRSQSSVKAPTVDDLLKNPFPYKLSRRGSVFINLTDELVDGPPPPRGYRDPKEIEQVVAKNQPMIEHCFRKEARRQFGLSGYVKVEFRISYAGYVIPESIRIVNSTIRSRKVEKCIKKYIRRWRNFTQLDEEMGIARVVQKFIFN